MANTVYHAAPGNTSLLTIPIATLDGFRGLAILLVMGYHYSHFLHFGWMGVDLFFVLSGFLITGKLVESRGANHYFRNFYLKRILRIIPLYFTVLLLFFVALPLIWPLQVSASMQQLQQQQLYYWLFTANVYDAVHGFPLNISLIHFWSLCCEMQFYLLWPFVVYFFRQQFKGAMVFLLALVVMSILFRINAGSFFSLSHVYRYVLLPCRLDAFSIGALVYLLVQRGRLQRYTIWLAVAAITILITILGVMMVRHIPWHFSGDIVSKYGYTLNALGWGCLLPFVLIAQHGIVHRIFSNPVLTWLGKYSYGIYVFHLPVYIFIAQLNRLNNHPSEKTFSLAATAMVVTCICSFASYHLLEKHFLKLKPATAYAKD